MAATSKHYGDVNLWIEKVIDSCTTFEHMRAAQNLVINFRNLYGRNIHDLEYKLNMKIIDKNYDMGMKLIKAI